MNARLFRILTTVLFGVLIVTMIWSLGVALTVPSYVAQAETNIACASAQANIEQLHALRRISNTLGLPHDTVNVPPLPEECMSETGADP